MRSIDIIGAGRWKDSSAARGKSQPHRQAGECRRGPPGRDPPAGQARGIEEVLAASGLLDLRAPPPPGDLERALEGLRSELEGAGLLRRALARGRAIACLEALGVADAQVLVAAALEGGAGNEAQAESAAAEASELEEVEPWPLPVDGAALLEEMAATSSRYLVLPPSGAETLALWALHAWAYDLFDISPRLAVHSPVKRCGKTRLLQVLAALAPRPLFASSVTAAAVFRAIEVCRPTLIIDEADTFLGKNGELCGVLNSGHCRDSARVVRAECGERGVRMFSTWAPCAVALIGKLPPPLADRSVALSLERRPPRLAIERLRAGELRGSLKPLRERCARWVLDHHETLRQLQLEPPAELDDRAADNWRPLLAIAKAAGDDWPARAREAALYLASRRVEAEDSLGLMALADLRAAFLSLRAERLTTRQIIEVFLRMEERPWAECRTNRPISPRYLALLLEPFGIRPVAFKLPGGPVTRGYRLEDCLEAFARYLPP
jgi:putative DNA primase/helicase